MVQEAGSGEVNQWKFDLQTPVLQQDSTFYRTATGKSQTKGKPRALMVAKLGGKQQLEAALKSGDVFEVEEGGKVFYAFQTVSFSVATSSKQKVGTKQADLQLTDEHSAGFDVFFGSFDPSLRVNSAFNKPKNNGNLFFKFCKRPLLFSLWTKTLKWGFMAPNVGYSSPSTGSVEGLRTPFH